MSHSIERYNRSEYSSYCQNFHRMVWFDVVYYTRSSNLNTTVCPTYGNTSMTSYARFKEGRRSHFTSRLMPCVYEHINPGAGTYFR
jgi:hypothetical protein